jgi:hypothetical protein
MRALLETRFDIVSVELLGTLRPTFCPVATVRPTPRRARTDGTLAVARETPLDFTVSLRSLLRGLHRTVRGVLVVLTDSIRVEQRVSAVRVGVRALQHSADLTWRSRRTSRLPEPPTWLSEHGAAAIPEGCSRSRPRAADVSPPLRILRRHRAGPSEATLDRLESDEGYTRLAPERNEASSFFHLRRSARAPAARFSVHRAAEHFSATSNDRRNQPVRVQTEIAVLHRVHVSHHEFDEARSQSLQ